MSKLSPDLFANGLAKYAAQLRNGSVSAEQATRYCLERIVTLDGQLNAFEYVDEASALNTARDIDSRLRAGTDLGPLMGIPVAIKDIFTVTGMPTTNGSNCDTTDLNGPEGTVITQLRKAGCVILGKTKTVEFALGATGINEARGTPWNPWDLKQHRIPGGSSSGSAVATVSGMCGFALGTDTGGSVRIPACFNGLFGHKTTVGRWATDGVFPLSTTLDSIGPLCRTAADAAIIHTAITGEFVPAIPSLKGLRFGIPSDYFFDDLDPEVATVFEAAVARLIQAGVTVVDIELPEAAEREELFPLIVPPELISQLTPERFTAGRHRMDSVTQSRAAHGLNINAVDYLQAQLRRKELELIAAQKLQGFDGWISPTCPFLPMTLESLEDSVQNIRSLLSSRNTQPANLFGLCATSIPIGQIGTTLPIGLQLMCGTGQDARLLAISVAIERCVGRHKPPEFLTR